MEEDVRLRAACDRCNSQKVRCPKKPDEESCSRCIKAKVSCNYSPFREKKTPKDNSNSGSALVGPQIPASKEKAVVCENEIRKRKRPRLELPATQDQNNHADTVLNWPLGQIDDTNTIDWTMNPFPNFQYPISNVPFLGFDGHVLMMPLESDNIFPQYNGHGNIRDTDSANHALLYSNDNYQVGRLAIDRNISHFNDPVDKDFAEETVKDCIQDLSKLSFDLLEHKQTIPPQSIHDVNHDLDDVAMKKLQKKCSSYQVEDTMRLTEKLIEIYPTFITGCMRGQSSQSSQSPPTTPSLDSESPVSGESTSNGEISGASASAKASSRPLLDHAPIMLIISCHLRLIDIYNELFAHMTACILLKGVTQNSLQCSMHGPQVKIGTYVPPQNAAASMEMLLLARFTSKLLQNAATLVVEIEKAEPPPFTISTFEDSTAAITRNAAQHLKGRASRMSQEFGSARNLMIQSGLL